MYPVFFTIVMSCLLSSCHNMNHKDFKNITTCEEFERGAKFDPTQVVDSLWRIFYFWSDTTELEPVRFSLVHKNSLKRFKAELEAMRHEWKIMWHLARFFFFPRPGVQVLYLDAYTPGAYRAVVKIDRESEVKPNMGPIFKMADIRIKQVDRFIFMMCCEDLTGFAMVREGEVPRTREECEDKAAVMKYRGYKGRCYLELMKERKERGLRGERRADVQAHQPAGRHRRHRQLNRSKDAPLMLKRAWAGPVLKRRRAGAPLHSSRFWERGRAL